MHRLIVLTLLLTSLALAGCGGPEDAEPAGPGPLALALKEKADASAAKMPAEVQAVFERAGDELAASDLLASVKQVGDEAPAFTLKGLFGTDISLDAFLANGPVVVAFYRGKW